MALAGMPLGYRFSIYDTSGSPSAGIGTLYSDPSNAQRELTAFLSQVDVVTYEFEHLPLDLANAIAAQNPCTQCTLWPPARTVNRKRPCLQSWRFRRPRTVWRTPRLNYALPCGHSACQWWQNPQPRGMTERSGRDSITRRSRRGLGQNWTPRLVVESFVTFSRELSVIAVRGVSGEVKTYPLVENHHHEGILRYTLHPPVMSTQPTPTGGRFHHAPAQPPGLRWCTGPGAVWNTGRVIANEMAPRVQFRTLEHEWCRNQSVRKSFACHQRAAAGNTDVRRPTCMINLIGCEIDLAAVSALPDCYIHLYDKAPRPGRKVGHINVCAENETALHQRVKQVLSIPPTMPEYPYAWHPCRAHIKNNWNHWNHRHDTLLKWLLPCRWFQVSTPGRLIKLLLENNHGFELPTLPYAKNALAPHIRRDPGVPLRKTPQDLHRQTEWSGSRHWVWRQITRRHHQSVKKRPCFQQCRPGLEHTFYWHCLSLTPARTHWRSRWCNQQEKGFRIFRRIQNPIYWQSHQQLRLQLDWLAGQSADGSLEIVNTSNAGTPWPKAKLRCWLSTFGSTLTTLTTAMPAPTTVERFLGTGQLGFRRQNLAAWVRWPANHARFKPGILFPQSV